MLDGTYAGLQASVADFLNRADLTATIPDFIRMAEVHLNRTIRVRKMVGQTTLNLVAGTEYYAMPSDFAEERTITVNTDPPLDLTFETMETLDEIARTQAVSYQATPRWVGIVGQRWRFRPLPDTAYVATITYFQKLPPVATNGTNWLLTDYPDAYLYGALTAAAPYLQADERTQVWGGLFNEAIQAIRHNETERLGKRLKADSGLRPFRRGLYNVQNDSWGS